MPELSIVVPAYNESSNLPLLYERLCEVLAAEGIDWEWIVVDDHSADETFTVVEALARRDPRVRGLRLARNHGSHLAIACGLRQARGACAVVLAADLQDPPETIPALLREWRTGAQVVWAVRAGREGEKASTLLFARLFYFLMRRLVGLHAMPATGADFLLLDRTVIDALGQFQESNISIMALITWMGFRQTSISYTKQARAHGRSGWSLAKKLKLVVDSVTSFSLLPIRVMSAIGCLTALAGFVYAAVVAVLALGGRTPVPGWSSLMIVVLVLGGLQMLMLGVLGEYLGRALDESRRRPRFLIEAMTNPASVRPPVGPSALAAGQAAGHAPAAIPLPCRGDSL